MRDDLIKLWVWGREKWVPLQPLTPFIASGLTLGAGLCSYRPLRMLLLFMAVLLFLEVAADFARSLLDKERAYASYQGPPKIIPVTWHQVVLAFALSCLYFFVIFEVLKLFFLPSGPGLVLVLLGVLVLSSLAAWRNTRLWWREGTDYQQALREEAHMSRKLRIPPVR